MIEGTNITVQCTVCGWEVKEWASDRFLGLQLWWMNRQFDLHYIKHAWEARND